MSYNYKKQELLVLQKIPHLEKNCYVNSINNQGEHVSIFIKNGLNSKRYNIIEPGNIIKAEIFNKNDRNYLSSFELKNSIPKMDSYQEYIKLFKLLKASQILLNEKNFSPEVYNQITSSIHNKCFKLEYYFELILLRILYIEGFVSHFEDTQDKILNKIIFYFTNTQIKDVHNIKIDRNHKKSLNNYLARIIEDNINSPSLQKLLQE